MSVERHKFDAWPGQEVRDLETNFIARRLGGQWRGLADRHRGKSVLFRLTLVPGDSSLSRFCSSRCLAEREDVAS